MNDEIRQNTGQDARSVQPADRPETRFPSTPIDLDSEQIETIGRCLPGGMSNVQGVYPLSPLQEGMLFHRLTNDDSDSYVLSILFELRSRSDSDVLIESLHRVIERHDALRIAVLWEGLPRPIQVVQRKVTLPIQHVALRPTDDPMTRLKQGMRPGHDQPLDLRRAPLMRLQIFSGAGTGTCYALLQVHHLVCDYQSLNDIASEVLLHARGEQHSLASPAAYRDHMTRALSDPGNHDAETFFREKLRDVSEPTAPFGLLDVHGDGSQLEEYVTTADAILARRVRDQARRSRISPARLFHSAWALVVAATSGRSDPVFGTVLSAARGRRSPTQRLLGLSVNTLPLRLQLDGLTAAQLVEQTDRELSVLLEHANTPLTVAQHCSGLSGVTPLFTALLNYRHTASSAGNDEDGIKVLATGEAWTNYPITMIVDDLGEGFSLTAQTERRIDPARMADYLLTALSSLVTALERNPGTPALQLQILPAQERKQLLETFNASRTSYPQRKLIHQLFEEQVECTPHAVAVSGGDRYLTYRQLNGQADQLARFLRERGVGPERFVGLCVERGVEMLVGMLGILKSGGAYVPLDPNYPEHRLAFMLSDTRPVMVLTQSHLRERLPAGTESVALDAQWDEIASYSSLPVARDEHAPSSRNLAYVIYTSGSTGQPKGVAIEHRSAVNMICWAQAAMPAEVFELTLQSTSLNFDLSVYECFVPLSCGGTLRIVQNALALVNEPADVTLINTVPSAIKGILDSGRVPATTRVVNLAGEALPGELVDRIFANSSVDYVCNLYGPSETTTYSTWVSMPRQTGFNRTIGHPVANTQIYILDALGQLVPFGAVGEIFIGGDGVARGYLNRPDLTAQRFLRDPFSADPNARMYKTGDLGRWHEDGSIEYLGRNDHQVKIRGFRIELGEIETRLTGHPSVSAAVVLAREDVPGEKRLVAYVVPRDVSSTPTAEELREHVKCALPEHMVPSAFVTLERVPLTPNGKLNRAALPAPDANAYSSRQYEAPRGEIEETLAELWQSLLGVERVGRRDHFFELGGHSLLIVQMMDRLRRAGLTTEVRWVFDNPTLSDLAQVLKRGTAEQFTVPPNKILPSTEAITPEMLPLIRLSATDIERIARAVPGGTANIQDIYPLVPLQEGILFHHRLDPLSGDTYVLSVALSVGSPERLDALVAALQSVIDRHDILRTAILWEGLPRPVQVVHRQARLSVGKLAVDASRPIAMQVHDWMQPERQHIDIRQAPPIKLDAVIDPSTKQCFTLLQFHHIAIDHTTLEIIAAEVVAHLQGTQLELPQPAPYRNHVAQSLAHSRAHDSETFFTRTLADVDEPTAPFGLLDVHRDGANVNEASEQLDALLAKRLRAQARKLGVSTATLFHAAWSLVVAHTSGRNDVVFGSLLLGRLQGSAGAQRILGVFINTLPLRLRLHDVSAQQLIERTHRGLAELVSHEQSSLAVAQRCSGIDGSAPLFTTLFNYRHSVSQLEAQWSAADGVRMLALQERTNYPITMSVDDFGEGYGLTALTDHHIDARRMTTYLRTSLESLVDCLEQTPHHSALALTVIPRDEIREVTELFNATAGFFPKDELVHRMFEKQAARTPTALAVKHGDHSLTYAELDQLTNRLARHLRQQGIDADDAVGICMERGVDMIVGLLGILKAGAGYLPLDPSYPPERIGYMLADAKPKAVLTQHRLVASLPNPPTTLVALDSLRDNGALDRYSAGPLTADEVGATPENLLYVIYTSGSTGQPKGTAMPHGSMTNLIEWHRSEFGDRDHPRVLQFAPLSFDVAFQEIFTTLAAGGTLVLLEDWVRKDPRALLKLIGTESIERLFVPPMMLQNLAESFTGARTTLNCLRDVVTAGEQLRISEQIISFFKQLTDCRLHNHYGPTETHVVTASTLKGNPEQWPTLPTIGAPILNCKILILDAQLQPVPFGVSGEIYIGGANLARGYLHRPELTAARFIRDPFGNDVGARLYKTGDLGRWLADGSIEYLGRNDDQVKVRGFRIELGEIEARLALHEQVKEVAVIVREDAPGDKRLVAYVTPQHDTEPSVESLRAQLKDALPEYMMPGAFVVLQSMPMTPSGKLNRRTLPAPDESAYISSQYEPPQGVFEETIAGIWQELLQLNRVGRDDNFFNLGGHSLLAMQVATRVESALAIEMPIRLLFEHPVLQNLAARAQALGSQPADAANGEDDTESLIRKVTQMPESEVQELLSRFSTG